MGNEKSTTLRRLKLLQITDCHLGGGADETLLGLNTEQSLRHVLAELATQNASFDYIIATGDISNDASVGSYERYLYIMREYFPATPLAWLEGNHDDPASMSSVSCERPHEHYFRLGNWQIICLSSRIPFEEGGSLKEKEIDRLSSLLAKDSDSPTLIFLHHQLVPVGSRWVDNYVVDNAHEFFSVIDRYSNVKAVSWGHVHQEFSAMHNHVHLFSTPSTCIQFKPKSAFFAVDRLMPGYRTFELHADGRFSSSVTRISERHYPIDFISTGY